MSNRGVMRGFQKYLIYAFFIVCFTHTNALFSIEMFEETLAQKSWKRKLNLETKSYSNMGYIPMSVADKESDPCVFQSPVIGKQTLDLAKELSLSTEEILDCSAFKFKLFEHDPMKEKMRLDYNKKLHNIYRVFFSENLEMNRTQEMLESGLRSRLCNCQDKYSKENKESIQELEEDALIDSSLIYLDYLKNNHKTFSFYTDINSDNKETENIFCSKKNFLEDAFRFRQQQSESACKDMTIEDFKNKVAALLIEPASLFEDLPENSNGAPLTAQGFKYKYEKGEISNAVGIPLSKRRYYGIDDIYSHGMKKIEENKSTPQEVQKELIDSFISDYQVENNSENENLKTCVKAGKLSFDDINNAGFGILHTAWEEIENMKSLNSSLGKDLDIEMRELAANISSNRKVELKSYNEVIEKSVNSIRTMLHNMVFELPEFKEFNELKGGKLVDSKTGLIKDESLAEFVRESYTLNLLGATNPTLSNILNYGMGQVLVDKSLASSSNDPKIVLNNLIKMRDIQKQIEYLARLDKPKLGLNYFKDECIKSSTVMERLCKVMTGKSTPGEMPMALGTDVSREHQQNIAQRSQETINDYTNYMYLNNLAWCSNNLHALNPQSRMVASSESTPENITELQKLDADLKNLAENRYVNKESDQYFKKVYEEGAEDYVRGFEKDFDQKKCEHMLDHLKKMTDENIEKYSDPDNQKDLLIKFDVEKQKTTSQKIKEGIKKVFEDKDGVYKRGIISKVKSGIGGNMGKSSSQPIPKADFGAHKAVDTFRSQIRQQDNKIEALEQISDLANPITIPQNGLDPIKEIEKIRNEYEDKPYSSEALKLIDDLKKQLEEQGNEIETLKQAKLKEDLDEAIKEKERLTRELIRERHKNRTNTLPPQNNVSQSAGTNKSATRSGSNSSGSTPSSTAKSKVSQSGTGGISSADGGFNTSTNVSSNNIHQLLGVKPTVSSNPKVSVSDSGKGFFSISVNDAFGDIFAKYSGTDEKGNPIYHVIRPDLTKMPLEKYFNEYWENVDKEFLEKIKKKIKEEAGLGKTSDAPKIKPEAVQNATPEEKEKAKNFYRVQGLNYLVDELQLP